MRDISSARCRASRKSFQQVTCNEGLWYGGTGGPAGSKTTTDYRRRNRVKVHGLTVGAIDDLSAVQVFARGVVVHRRLGERRGGRCADQQQRRRQQEEGTRTRRRHHLGQTGGLVCVWRCCCCCLYRVAAADGACTAGRGGGREGLENV